MRSLILRSATAALLATALAPAAFAQPIGDAKPGYHPYASVGRAPVCTQLELKAGLTGKACGRVSVAELTHWADRASPTAFFSPNRTQQLDD